MSDYEQLKALYLQLSLPIDKVSQQDGFHFLPLEIEEIESTKNKIYQASGYQPKSEINGIKIDLRKLSMHYKQNQENQLAISIRQENELASALRPVLPSIPEDIIKLITNYSISKLKFFKDASVVNSNVDDNNECKPSSPSPINS